jgi:hypothetical protein
MKTVRADRKKEEDMKKTLTFPTGPTRIKRRRALFKAVQAIDYLHSLNDEQVSTAVSELVDSIRVRERFRVIAEMKRRRQ